MSFDTSAVQGGNQCRIRRSGPRFVDLALHAGTVVIGTDNAEGQRMASEDGTADVLP
jgi:hypothetical protein